MDKEGLKVDDEKKMRCLPYASVYGDTSTTKFDRPSTGIVVVGPTITYQNSKRHSCASTCGFLCTPTPATWWASVAQ